MARPTTATGCEAITSAKALQMPETYKTNQREFESLPAEPQISEAQRIFVLSYV